MAGKMGGPPEAGHDEGWGRSAVENVNCIVEAFGEDTFARTIGLHHADRELAAGILAEGNPLAFP